jgi:hypothetical protein
MKNLSPRRGARAAVLIFGFPHKGNLENCETKSGGPVAPAGSKSRHETQALGPASHIFAQVHEIVAVFPW